MGLGVELHTQSRIREKPRRLMRQQACFRPRSGAPADLIKKALETKFDVRSEQELSFNRHRHGALGASHVRVHECGTGRWKLMQMDADAIQSSTAPQQGQRSGGAHVERARSLNLRL